MKMMNPLATRLREQCQLEGMYTLRSGRTASEYFDKYRFEAVPDLLAEVARSMLPLIPPGTEVLAGLEMGAIAVATMLSHFSGLPAAFVRKAAKRYGTARLCEGAEISGKSLLIVEDVVTSGGQVVLSTGELRSRGAKLAHALCVIDREEGGAEALSKVGISLIALFRRADLGGDTRD
jgi:orotate phosphoribosyltransferase